MNEDGLADNWWEQDLSHPVDPPEQLHGWKPTFDKWNKLFADLARHSGKTRLVWEARADELDRKMWRKLAGLDAEPEPEPAPVSKHPREDTTKSYPTSVPGRRGKKRYRHHR